MARSLAAILLWNISSQRLCQGSRRRQRQPLDREVALLQGLEAAAIVQMHRVQGLDCTALSMAEAST